MIASHYLFFRVLASEELTDSKMADWEFEFQPDLGKVSQLKRLLTEAKKVVITCHVSPDGDALGSSLGLWHLLREIFPYKKTYVVTPDRGPRQLDFMPGFWTVTTGSSHPEEAQRLMEEADLMVCLDFNETKRVDRLEEILKGCTAQKVVIDHHLTDHPIDSVLTISHPEISSTSALLYMLVCAMGWEKGLSLKAAECICTGMVTDTGNFSYNSLDPDLYLIMARMVRRGIDKDRISRLALEVTNESSLRLQGYALSRMNLLPEHQAAIIAMSRRDLEQFDYSKGDTEGLVNQPLRLDKIRYSVFLREDPDGPVKVSMRSKGEFPVNLICSEQFGGGGHLNAAGGDFDGTLSQALEKLLQVLPLYDKYL